MSKEDLEDEKSNSNAKGTTRLAPGQCPVPATSSRDPVDLATRDYYETVPLISVDAPGSPLELALSYNSATGWKTNYDTTPTQAAADRRQRTFEFTGNQLAAVIDRLGFRRSLTYGPTGRLSRIIDDVSGRSIDLVFDSALRRYSVSSAGAGTVTVDLDGNDQVSMITDSLGNSTRYSYAAGGSRLATKTDATGAVIVINTYDPVMLKIASQDDASPASPAETFTAGLDTTAGQAIQFTKHQSRLGGERTIYFDNFGRPTRDQSPVGDTVTYVYDTASGNVAQQTDPLGNTTRFTYDAAGFLLTRTDPLGRVASYTYDAGHNLITAADEGGAVSTMTYDAKRRMLSRTDPAGGVTTYTYTPAGLLATETSPTGGITRYTYDAAANRIGAVDPAGRTTTWTYDAAGRVLTRADGTGNTYAFSWDLKGRLLTSSDPLGRTTGYAYDGADRVVQITAPTGGVTRYAYDANGNLITVTDATGAQARYEYDADDRMVRSIDPLGRVSTVSYDLKGRTTGATDPLGNATTLVYDAADRVVHIADALNRSTTLAYDPLGRLLSVLDPAGNNRRSEYTATGLVARRVDPAGNATNHAYDAAGRLVGVSPPSTGQATQATQAYDLAGNLTHVTDLAGNTTNFSRDAAGRVLQESSSGGAVTTYTLDADGRIATQTNGRGQVTVYTRDAAGQVVRKVDPAGAVDYSYDANGNLLSARDPLGAVTFTYDLLDRMTSTTDVFGNRIGYAYDVAGRLTTLTYPGNRVVSYAYDAADRLLSVTDWSGRVTRYAHDPAGQVASVTRPNGTSGAYTYDANGRLASLVEAGPGGAQLYSISHTYDANGNIAAENMLPQPAAPVLATSSLAYGPDNRLASFNGQAVSYDADGNMTSGPVGNAFRSMAFDARSRLTAIGSSAYTYDALDQRVAATHGGVTTHYVVDPNAVLPRVLMETDAQGMPTAFYVYGLGLVSRESTTEGYRAYHYDVRGSAVRLTDASGVVKDSYRYGPYGELWSSSGTSTNPFRFVGRDGVMTEPSGLYYMRARYYTPDAKRFVGRDRLAGTVIDPLSLNRHAYVHANPVSAIDPSGFVPLPIPVSEPTDLVPVTESDIESCMRNCLRDAVHLSIRDGLRRREKLEAEGLCSVKSRASFEDEAFNRRSERCTPAACTAEIVRQKQIERALEDSRTEEEGRFELKDGQFVPSKGKGSGGGSGTVKPFFPSDRPRPIGVRG